MMELRAAWQMRPVAAASGALADRRALCFHKSQGCSLLTEDAIWAVQPGSVPREC